MNTFTTRTLSTLALILALALPSTLAAGQLHVDASEAPFADAADLMGVDLAWDGDLVLVLGEEGDGSLGDAIVPIVDVDGLPTDALGRVIADEALARSGVVVATSGGASFVLDDTDALSAAASFADRLAALGFEMDATDDDHVLTFTRDGSSFRATFATDGEGVLVYVGAI